MKFEEEGVVGVVEFEYLGFGEVLGRVIGGGGGIGGGGQWLFLLYWF